MDDAVTLASNASAVAVGEALSAGRAVRFERSSDQLPSHADEATIAEVRRSLETNGFTGLYSPDGRCGCSIDQLAPCGTCSREGDEQYINGCDPGYKHLDPRPGHIENADYVITSDKTPPEEDEFDNFYE